MPENVLMMNDAQNYAGNGDKLLEGLYTQQNIGQKGNEHDDSSQKRGGTI